VTVARSVSMSASVRQQREQEKLRRSLRRPEAANASRRVAPKHHPSWSLPMSHARLMVQSTACPVRAPWNQADTAPWRDKSSKEFEPVPRS
jgi:hypothetical protein